MRSCFGETKTSQPRAGASASLILCFHGERHRVGAAVAPLKRPNAGAFSRDQCPRALQGRRLASSRAFVHTGHDLDAPLESSMPTYLSCTVYGQPPTHVHAQAFRLDLRLARNRRPSFASRRVRCPKLPDRRVVRAAEECETIVSPRPAPAYTRPSGAEHLYSLPRVPGLEVGRCSRLSYGYRLCGSTAWATSFSRSKRSYE